MAALSQNVNSPAAGGRPQPSFESFYAASFNGNEWSIIDVQPLSDSDSKVRFIRVYDACGSYRVREVDHVFEGVSVRELTGDADVCIPEKKLVREMRRFPSKEQDTNIEQWEPRSPGIEAQCGTERLIHHLVPSYLLDFEKLEDKAPGIAALWALPQQILARCGECEEQLYSDHRPDRNLSQQAAIEIRNGDYDLALPELPEWLRTNGETKLSQIIPGPEEATGPEPNFGVIENVEHLALMGDPTVPYPTLALIAHVQGDVVLNVYVDPPTGLVQNVTTTSGHPILARAATDAISAWTFHNPYSGENPLRLTVHFTVRCPPTIDTTIRTAPSQRHRRRNKPGHQAKPPVNFR